MTQATPSRIPEIVARRRNDLLSGWLAQQRSAPGVHVPLLSGAETEDQSKSFLDALGAGLAGGDLENLEGTHWSEARDFLRDVSRSRAMLGFKPSETASFIFSLKQPLFEILRTELAQNPVQLAEETWRISTILDHLGLLTMEAYQAMREEIILRQQQELLELSTPVVRLWDRILALPLVGTLDSARTQVVMETLLQRIVETGSEIAIIDITGVPTVDTLVAQHLLKTIAATRLMGADCIISGIRPQIAQTIVHLGVDLGTVVTKATLADAFGVALERTRAKVSVTPATSAR
jgi:rsbT co-antagonist protein RsbR